MRERGWRLTPVARFPQPRHTSSVILFDCCQKSLFVTQGTVPRPPATKAVRLTTCNVCECVFVVSSAVVELRCAGHAPLSSAHFALRRMIKVHERTPRFSLFHFEACLACAPPASNRKPPTSLHVMYVSTTRHFVLLSTKTTPSRRASNAAQGKSHRGSTQIHVIHAFIDFENIKHARQIRLDCFSTKPWVSENKSLPNPPSRQQHKHSHSQQECSEYSARKA